MAVHRNILALFTALVLVLAAGALWWFRSEGDPLPLAPEEAPEQFPAARARVARPAAPVEPATAAPNDSQSSFEIDGTLRPGDVERVLGVLEPLIAECVTDHRAQFSGADGGGVGYRFGLESQAGKTTLSGLQLVGIRSMTPWVDACLADLQEEAPLPPLQADGKATVTQHLQP